MENRIIPRPENTIHMSKILQKNAGSNMYFMSSPIVIDVNTSSLVLVYSVLNIFQPQVMKVPGPMLPISSDTMSSSSSEPSHQILFRAPYSEDVSILRVQYVNGGVIDGIIKNGVNISCNVEFPESYAEIGSIEMQLDAGAIIVG